MKKGKFLFWLIPLYVLGYIIVKPDGKPYSIWTPSYEKLVRDKILEKISLVIKSQSQREEYTACYLSKLKTTLPDGLTSVPTDSLPRIYNIIDRECISTIKDLVLNSWNPQMLAILKNGLLKNEGIAVLTAEQKDKFCDCYLDEVQVFFPNGLVGKIDNALQLKLENKCIKQLNLDLRFH